MICRYYSDTDMLYVELTRKVTTESEEVAPNIVLDFDENNQVIGIEIEDASQLIDLSRLELAALPITDLVFSKALPMEAPPLKVSGNPLYANPKSKQMSAVN